MGRLSEPVPSFEDRVLCFDGAPLLERLLEKGTFGHGAVKGNRINETKHKIDKELLSMGRRGCDERVQSDGSVSLVKWMDTRFVMLMSSCLGSDLIDTAKRYDKNRDAILMSHDLKMFASTINSKVLLT